MRIAIISDIHGNLVALEAAISDIQREKVDRVVCLGDVAAVGPQPRETVSLLQKMKWEYVMGNSDESLVNPLLEDSLPTTAPEEERKRMNALDEWTTEQLNESDKKFLSSFKPTIIVRSGTKSLFCYHGSPRSNTEGVTATMSDDQLTEVLGDHDATLFAGGHTHTQMVRRFRGSTVVNPGSIGLPFNKDSDGKIRNPAWAEYAMVTLGSHELGVELRRKWYDLAKLNKVVRGSGLPDPDWWLSDWF